MKVYDLHIHAEGDNIPNPDLLLENMGKAGIYGGAVISVRPTESYGRIKMEYEERMQNVLAWTRGYEGRLFPILWIHPREKDIKDKIRDAAARGIAGFKMICDDYYVYDDISVDVLHTIAEVKKPLLFHTGILWLGDAVAANYNRPANWEIMIKIPDIRFALAHCSWPWYDECIAMYGRIRAKKRFDPAGSSEMFFDLTPGAHKIYREDLFYKLHNLYPTSQNIMFGTDNSADNYSAEDAKMWLDFDNGLYKKLGIADEVVENIYQNNFLRFIGAE